MPLRKSIQRANNFFRKTLQNLKSARFPDYQKLPKVTLLSPFSCCHRSSRYSQSNDFNTNYCREDESDPGKAKKGKKGNAAVREEPVLVKDIPRESSMPNANHTPVKQKRVEYFKQEEKQKASRLSKREEQKSNQNTKRGGHPLAQKMKELEMMDAGDMDVEEALHYYSQLKSPVYLDIVDNFFTDMYHEYSVPQASASINSSRRRLGSIRL